MILWNVLGVSFLVTAVAFLAAFRLYDFVGVYLDAAGVLGGSLAVRPALHSLALCGKFPASDLSKDRRTDVSSMKGLASCRASPRQI